MKNVIKNGVLLRSAFEAKHYAVLMKILAAVLGGLTALSAVVYVVAVMYTKFGSYTVTVNKFDSLTYGLSLCETPDFDNPVIRLNAKTVEEVTNISGDWIANDVNKINGSHNGENYLAYTYYCKNTGNLTVTYEYNLFIANVTNHVDKAIRFKVYVDDKPVTYARTKTNGGGAEAGTTEFLSSTTIVRKQIAHFKPGDVTKYTVVIWLEGNDPDCTDDLMGGSIKSDMSMSVVTTEPEDKDAKTTTTKSAS